jgi:hypothetical protein
MEKGDGLGFGLGFKSMMVGQESLDFKIKGYPMVDKCRVKLKEHGCMKMSDPPCLEVKIKGMSSISTMSLLKGLYTA